MIVVVVLVIVYLVVSIKLSRQYNPLIASKEATWFKHPVYFTKALHLCVLSTLIVIIKYVCVSRVIAKSTTRSHNSSSRCLSTALKSLQDAICTAVT